MPKVFGYQHIIYTLIMVALMITSIVFIKKFVKKEKTLSIIVRLVGVLLFSFIAFNRIAITYYDKSYLSLIPNSFCGFTSFMLSLTLIFGKKDNIFLHCLMYLAIVGGLITMVYPDFIGQSDSIFFSKTISGLLHHTVMVYAFFLCTITGYFVPTIKKWYVVIIGGSFYIFFGYFLIYILGVPHAMEINSPLLSGTILYWYVIGPIFVAIYFIIVGIWELVRKKISTKTSK